MLSEAKGNCRHGMGGSCVADALQTGHVWTVVSQAGSGCRRLHAASSTINAADVLIWQRPYLELTAQDGSKSSRYQTLCIRILLSSNKTGWVASSPRC